MRLSFLAVACTFLRATAPLVHTTVSIEMFKVPCTRDAGATDDHSLRGFRRLHKQVRYERENMARTTWAEIPGSVSRAFEDAIGGEVVEAASQSGGFSSAR